MNKPEFESRTSKRKFDKFHLFVHEFSSVSNTTETQETLRNLGSILLLVNAWTRVHRCIQFRVQHYYVENITIHSSLVMQGISILKKILCGHNETYWNTNLNLSLRCGPVSEAGFSGDRCRTRVGPEHIHQMPNPWNRGKEKGIKQMKKTGVFQTQQSFGWLHRHPLSICGVLKSILNYITL